MRLLGGASAAGEDGKINDGMALRKAEEAGEFPLPVRVRICRCDAPAVICI
jgi:hypothetical protein